MIRNQQATQIYANHAPQPWDAAAISESSQAAESLRQNLAVLTHRTQTLLEVMLDQLHACAAADAKHLSDQPAAFA